jgi:GNAT superfamily N-acetyltransferase
VQTFSGNIFVKVDGEWAGEAEFIIHEDNIYLSSLNIVDGFQHNGLGRIIIDMLKSFAEAERKPITVCSYNESVWFYRKCGFTSSNSKHKDQRAKVAYTFLKPDYTDMFWIPKSLEKRKRIRIRF